MKIIIDLGHTLNESGNVEGTSKCCWMNKYNWHCLCSACVWARCFTCAISCNVQTHLFKVSTITISISTEDAKTWKDKGTVEGSQVVGARTETQTQVCLPDGLQPGFSSPDHMIPSGAYEPRLSQWCHYLFFITAAIVGQIDLCHYVSVRGKWNFTTF